MRVFITLYIILLLLLTGSCQESSYTSQLHRAEELIEERPDSALKLLLELKPRLQQVENGNTHSLYGLLRVKAQDKAYIPHQTDTVITSVVAYYEKVSDRKRLPEAYYYAGRVYRDLGDAPLALNYFQKALDRLPQDEEYGLRSRIYSQMGMLFSYQNMNVEALRKYEQAFVCDSVLNDSLGLIYDFRDMAYSYMALGVKDSAELYYQRALLMAEEVQDDELIAMMRNQFVGYYQQIGDYGKAKQYLDCVTNHHTSSASDIISAKLYHGLGMIDSAYFYYEKSLASGNIYAKRTAFRGLSEIAIKQHDVLKASLYLRNYLLCEDSIKALEDVNNIRHLQACYNYQFHQDRHHALAMENEQKKLVNLIYIFLVILLLGGMILLVRSIKRKRKLYQKQQKELELLIENAKKQQQIRKMFESKYAKEHPLEKYPIYKRLLEIANLEQRGSFTDDDWIELGKAIDEAFPGFTVRLNRVHSFNKIEYQVSLLVKLNIPPGKIAILVGRADETISSTRRRLYLKVFHKKCSPESWDEFIHSIQVG